jgi:hypothetical protein
MKATINRNANAEQGRIDLALIHDTDGRFRWYQDDTDSEVSGATIAEAHEAARSAWGSGDWDLLTDWTVCPDCGHCGDPEDDAVGCGCHCAKCGARL